LRILGTILRTCITIKGQMDVLAHLGHYDALLRRQSLVDLFIFFKGKHVGDFELGGCELVGGSTGSGLKWLNLVVKLTMCDYLASKDLMCS